jgi:hypothetical protein
LAASFQAGVYNNAVLSVNGVSVLAGSQAPEAEVALEEQQEAGIGGSGSSDAPADGSPAGSSSNSRRGGRRAIPAVLPLEILPAGEFEPLYRVPLDVRNGELPVLPLSIYGAGEQERIGGPARVAGRSCH